MGKSPGITLIHYTFTTKYRRDFFDTPAKIARVRGAITGAAIQQGAEIRAIACVCNHVHVMIVLPRTKTVSLLAQEMKRQSSILLRRWFPELREIDHLWGRRYHHRSVSGSETQVKQYIDAHMKEWNRNNA